MSFDEAWLTLREGADHAARTAGAAPLVAALRGWLADRPGPVTVLDLGAGTGSGARWLAPRLPGPQHWVLLDHDGGLLGRVAQRMVAVHDGDGVAVRLTARQADLTDVSVADLRPVSLVTGTALLDLLTAGEVHRLAATCLRAAVPALFALSVTGDVLLRPGHRLDSAFARAFDEHQRRTLPGGRGLLGPDAVAVARRMFAAGGARVLVRDTPWTLGSGRRALAAQWLAGWVGAAVEQSPALAAPAADYLALRGAQAGEGLLRVTVGHRDLLALPPTSRSHGQDPGRKDPGRQDLSQ